MRVAAAELRPVGAADPVEQPASVVEAGVAAHEIEDGAGMLGEVVGESDGAGEAVSPDGLGPAVAEVAGEVQQASEPAGRADEQSGWKEVGSVRRCWPGFGGYCRARSGGDGSCSRPRCCDGIATWCGAAGLPPPAWPWRSDARPRRGLSMPRTKQMQHRLRRCGPSTLTITTATARTAPWSRHRHSRPGVPVALAPPARIVRRDRLGGLIHEYAQAA